MKIHAGTKLELGKSRLCEALVLFGLEINVDKTEVLHFGFKEEPVPKFKIYGSFLKRVQCFRYLGCDINSNLSFQNHAERIMDNAMRAISTVSGILRKMEITNFSKIYFYYKTFVFSQLFGVEFVPCNLLFTKIQDLEVLFFKGCFNLPQSFPRSFIDLVFRHFEGEDAIMKRRMKLLSSAYDYDGRCGLRLNAALANDVEELYPRSGFLHDTEGFWGFLFDGALLNFDFSLLGLDAVRRYREWRESQAWFLSFDFISLETVHDDCFDDGRFSNEFFEFLSVQGLEETRIILLFFVNGWRWSYTNQKSRLCQICKISFRSAHFFACPRVAHMLNFSYSQIIDYGRNDDWESFLKCLLITLKCWASLSGVMRVSLLPNLEELTVLSSKGRE